MPVGYSQHHPFAVDLFDRQSGVGRRKQDEPDVDFRREQCFDLGGCGEFLDHKFDVLVSTTIVESGLDVSNANTIIVNHAERHGLADLHQLRGRVGRNDQKAFCYLLVPSVHSLTKEARQRLQAVEEFSDLGSGFNLSMRDLDIRGAGNMLGAEQSGFIEDVGFETYHKILDEAVQELRHEEFADVFADALQRDGPTVIEVLMVDRRDEIISRVPWIHPD